jgi:hypothetical protein
MNDEQSSTEREGEIVADAEASNRLVIQLSSQTKVIVVGSALVVSAALAWGLSHASPRYVSMGSGSMERTLMILDTWTGTTWIPRLKDGVYVAQEAKLGEPTPMN